MMGGHVRMELRCWCEWMLQIFKSQQLLFKKQASFLHPSAPVSARKLALDDVGMGSILQPFIWEDNLFKMIAAVAKAGLLIGNTLWLVFDCHKWHKHGFPLDLFSGIIHINQAYYCQIPDRSRNPPTVSDSSILVSQITVNEQEKCWHGMWPSIQLPSISGTDSKLGLTMICSWLLSRWRSIWRP